MTPAGIITKLECAQKQSQMARRNLSAALMWAARHNQDLMIGLQDQGRDLDRVLESMASLLGVIRAQNESGEAQL